VSDVVACRQGWARDVKARDRDAHLPRRDRGVGFTSRNETLKFRDKDVCSSREVIETLKFKFF